MQDLMQLVLIHPTHSPIYVLLIISVMMRLQNTCSQPSPNDRHALLVHGCIGCDMRDRMQNARDHHPH